MAQTNGLIQDAEALDAEELEDQYRMGILGMLCDGVVPHVTTREGWELYRGLLQDRVEGRLWSTEVSRAALAKLQGDDKSRLFSTALQSLSLQGLIEKDSIRALSGRMAFLFYRLTLAGKELYESRYKRRFTGSYTLLDFNEEEKRDL